MAIDITTLPISTLFILCIAAGISLMTSLANRLLTDPKKSREWRKEISEWNSQLRTAQKNGDKKTVEKLMKKQKQIMQLQTKLSWQQMKVTLIFLIPLFIIWQFLGAFYYGRSVAYFPGIGPDLPLPIFNTSLIWWYLLCSMFFGTIFTHLFGVIEVSE